MPDKITSADVSPPPPEEPPIMMPSFPHPQPVPMHLPPMPPMMHMPPPHAAAPPVATAVVMTPKPKGAPMIPVPPETPPPDFGSESEDNAAPPKGKGYKGANGFGKTGKGVPEVIVDDEESDGEAKGPDKPLGYWVKMWHNADEKSGVKRALHGDDTNPKHAKVKNDSGSYAYSKWQKGWHTNTGKEYVAGGEKWWPSHKHLDYDFDDGDHDYDEAGGSSKTWDSWKTLSAASCSYRGMK